jgi:hypothetical protein
MACPPGMVLNPQTLRCISSRGRIAKELVKAGAIDAGELRYGVGLGARRQTQKAPRSPALYAYEPGPRPALVTLPQQQQGRACPLGYEQNPRSGRCIRTGGRTFKRIYEGAAHVPFLAPPAPAAPRLPMGAGAVLPRRVLSEKPPAVLPEGMPAVAPLTDRRSILAWIANNCRNAVDPLTRASFLTSSTENLQEALRLHDGTCTFATPLNALITTEHKAGRIVPIPGATDRTPLSLEDFRVLRDTMRRRDPAYKLPARRHAPAPPEWKLYVASDSRSGSDYATVGFVDTTKGRRTLAGVVYPPDAFRVSMGYIPSTAPRGSTCSIQTVVDLLQRLADANRLLVPTAGGWRPIAGFPFTKAQWEDGHRAQRLGRLCKDLARALLTPL